MRRSEALMSKKPSITSPVQSPVIAMWSVLLLVSAGWASPAPQSYGVAAQSAAPLLLPMRGAVRVIGALPGEGDHVGRDEFAVDLQSDDPKVYPTAPGRVAY